MPLTGWLTNNWRTSQRSKSRDRATQCWVRALGFRSGSFSLVEETSKLLGALSFKVPIPVIRIHHEIITPMLHPLNAIPSEVQFQPMNFWETQTFSPHHGPVVPEAALPWDLSKQWNLRSVPWTCPVRICLLEDSKCFICILNCTATISPTFFENILNRPLISNYSLPSHCLIVCLSFFLSTLWYLPEGSQVFDSSLYCWCRNRTAT